MNDIKQMFLFCLLHKLNKLKTKNKYKHEKGICSYLSYVQVLYIQDIFIKWPKYSGLPKFPVPSPYKSVSHGAAYFKYQCWSKKSQYGKDRHELLDFVIATVEQQLKDLS